MWKWQEGTKCQGWAGAGGEGSLLSQSSNIRNLLNNGKDILMTHEGKWIGHEQKINHKVVITEAVYLLVIDLEL